VGVVALAWDAARLQRIASDLVAVAVGALYGDAFLHLVPEAAVTLDPRRASLLVMAGIFAFFLLEKLLRRRDLHHRRHHQPVVEVNLTGDALHNLVDGMLIAASYAVGVPLGVTTTAAVLLHEIPQELGDFGVLVHGGLSARRAILLNFLSALAAVGGALLAFALGARIGQFSTYLVPITAGGFLYLAGSNLVPELQHEPGGARAIGRQLLFVASGVSLMAGLGLVE
jgi:zinc and cadmium transporter